MQPRRVLIAIAVLAVCLAVVELPSLRTVFDLVAQAIARIADPILNALALPVERQGNELRAVDGAWAVIVTDVCDGHGLVAAWLALCAALAPLSGRGALAVAAGVFAIQIFNLVRVVALAAALARAPEAFETLHLEAFPLLTTALMALLAAAVVASGGRRLVVALGLGAVLSLGWFVVADPVAGAVLVPAANALLTSAGPDVVREITQVGGDWGVGTRLLAREDPPSFYRVPIYPADFLVALPALVAAWVAARRGAAMVGLALCAAAVALALGAVTGLWRAMELAAGPLRIVRLDAMGTAVGVATAELPPEAVRALARLLQNVIVHANLLVLPPLVLVAGRPDNDR